VTSHFITTNTCNSLVRLRIHICGRQSRIRRLLQCH
jgi:hypothetical protein